MGRYLRFDWHDVLDWLERRKADFRPSRLRTAESGD